MNPQAQENSTQAQNPYPGPAASPQPQPDIGSGSLSSQASPQPPTPLPLTPQPQASGTMPQIADDTDLIEKEWVDKAKEIVEQTAHDPHLQNEQINLVKMEYLKKRYNKDMKLSDD